MNPLRILHVISTLSAGGAPRGVIELVTELERQPNLDVTLCVLGTPEAAAPHAHLLRPPVFLDCPVHLRGTGWQRWRRLRNLIHALQPDIVHSHLWPSAAQVERSGWGIPFRHVSHVRDTPPAFALTSLRGRLRKLWLKYQLSQRPITYVPVSVAARDFTHQHLGVPLHQLRVILNGVDLSKFESTRSLLEKQPAPVEGAVDLVIGTAGRLIPDKGQHLLIEAVARLSQAGLPVRLRIAGTGGRLADLQQQAAVLKVAERVEFLGQVDDMHGFLQSIDIFALPSLAAEGLPRVLLEAMAAGCPVVASDCAGVDEVLQGDDGLLVPVGDVDKLTDCLHQVVTDRELRIRLANAGRVRVQSAFSVKRVADQVAALYREL